MHLEDNVAALNVPLTDDVVKRIEDVAPLGFASGTRYPAAMMGALNQ